MTHLLARLWRLPGDVAYAVYAFIRRLPLEVSYAAYVTGLRGYCTPCDALRWRWTHRDCCARQRAVGRRIAALLGEWRDSDGH